ncbi:MAG: baseplate J/gp47 family protein [Chloroflexi bacterium]|nr:baseplate J/gp47 family protein [Chloroflexota bacterium]
MSVWYLELDDEITDAVARLRAAKDDRVVFVVPAGSRIGTGRINFRLLAREAEQRGLHIALVSGDTQVRGLAASAGLPTYATVGESERGEAAEREARAAGRIPGAVVPIEGTATPVPGTGSTALVSTAPGPGGTRLPTVPPKPPRTRRRKLGLVVSAFALVGVLSGGALLAVYNSVPTAAIRLVLRPERFGPEVLAIRVSPTEPTSVELGVVQGTPITVEVTGEVKVIATGTNPSGDYAKGTVTFTNLGNDSVPIPARTQVWTADGARFETLGSVMGLAPGESIDVEVWALQEGEDGNVGPGTVTEMEPTLRARLGNGTVTNQDALTGGARSEGPVILDADYDRAVGELTSQLQASLRTRSEDPDELEAGSIVYPSTLRADPVVVNQQRDQVVARLQAELPITGTLSGTVLSVKDRSLREMAAHRLDALVESRTLLPGSVDVDLGPVTPDGQAVTYDATASGLVYGLDVDQASLKDQVRNKTILEAAAILDEYGQVTITLSPDFLPTLPDDPNRIRLDVEAPQPGATIAP